MSRKPWADGSRYPDKGNPLAHLYTERRWRTARLRFLKAHPLCVYCKAEGHTKAADVVDHIKPHRGDLVLFWDVSNWQGLCTRHHNSHKQSIEKGGMGRVRIGEDGWPV